MKKILSVLLALCAFSTLNAQNYSPDWNSLNTRKIPEWFQQDKFGIFIHWGVYAVPSYAPVIPNSGDSYSEWYWYRLMTNQKAFRAFHDKNYGSSFLYPAFESSFKAELYEPEKWAELFKASGARYVVLTSKHHEGYCLWNSAEADKHWGRPWNAVTGTPKRDLLGDLTKAVRDSGMKMGFYYSLYEWYNPLWQADRKRFVDEHMHPQFKDLVNRYKPSIIFSDGEWDMSDTAWKSPELLAWLYNESPVADSVVVNDRWGSNTRGKNTGSTYTTSEYGSGMDATVVWEESQGIGHSYGYNRNEDLADYKTSSNLILLLVDIVSRGGNLLLDIGPTADGRVPVIMQQRLSDMGKWLQQNGEAIYGTTPLIQPYQWSEGQRPEKKGESYMSGYNIMELVEKKKGKASIEIFFTQKGNDLFCIVPHYNKSLTLKGFRAPKNARASIAGHHKVLPLKQQGNDCVIDLTSYPHAGIPGMPYVVKIENGSSGIKK